MPIAIALVYLGFYSLIGFAVWATGSAWPLLAVLLSPSWTSGPTKKEGP